jgi:hypothetical protein
MEWKGGRFILTDLTKVIGILLILTLPIYVFFKKRYYSTVAQPLQKTIQTLKN